MGRGIGQREYRLLRTGRIHVVTDGERVLFRGNADSPRIPDFGNREMDASIPLIRHESPRIITAGDGEAAFREKLHIQRFPGRQVIHILRGGVAGPFLQHDADSPHRRRLAPGAGGEQQRQKSAEKPCADDSFNMKFCATATHGNRAPRPRRQNSGLQKQMFEPRR